MISARLLVCCSIAVFALLVFLLLATSASGADSATGSGASVGAGDVKLLADFQNQTLSVQGKSAPMNTLNMEGAAYIIPGEGLAVYKGGVNEIVDPCFEGSGWQLGQGASVDSTAYSACTSSLKISGSNLSGVLAQPKQRVKVLAPGSRALSFHYLLSDQPDGSIIISIKAYDKDGNLIDTRSDSVNTASNGWALKADVIEQLPRNTDSYDLEIAGDDFSGTVYLDAFLVEAKNYFTPYYDGDSPNAQWTSMPSPQNPSAFLFGVSTKKLLAKIILLTGGVLLVVGVAGVRLVRNLKSGGSNLMKVFDLAVIVVILGFGAFTSGVISAPHIWPESFRLEPGSLQPGQMYFYRVSSVDASGRESPLSYEVRAETEWFKRQVGISWDAVPGAEKYRIYRGVKPREEDTMFEISAESGMAAWNGSPRASDPAGVYDISGNSVEFPDSGEPGQSVLPEVGLQTDNASPQASPSLRPDSDVRVKTSAIGLDAASSFWVTGEVKFGFDDTHQYKPASLFEVGDPTNDSSFAVSTRNMTAWGDEYPKILLIKNSADSATTDTDYQKLPVIKPGANIRYVAAQLYEPSGSLPAGVHLWYRIDDGQVNHIWMGNTAPLVSDPVLLISKRYFYDYFANNSVCRSFAAVQGGIAENEVNQIMGQGSVPELVSQLSR